MVPPLARQNRLDRPSPTNNIPISTLTPLTTQKTKKHSSKSQKKSTPTTTPPALPTAFDHFNQTLQAKSRTANPKSPPTLRRTPSPQPPTTPPKTSPPNQDTHHQPNPTTTKTNPYKTPKHKPSTPTTSPPSPYSYQDNNDDVNQAYLITWNAYIHHEPDPAKEQRLPPLTGATIKNILQATLDHHQARKPIILLAIHEVTYLNTKVPSPSSRRNTNFGSPKGHVSTFRIQLKPATTEDQFDSELYHEQALKFVLQKWNHHHKDDFTTDPTTGHQDILPPGTAESLPTTNERAPQLRLYAPACNHPDCRGLGILAGLPPKTLFHKRAFLDILSKIREQLLPFLPPELHSTADFTTHYGLRDGTITGNQTTKGPHLTLPTIIISASSTDKFDTLLEATEAFTSANKKDITYHNIPFHLLPFPDGPMERMEYINSIKTIDTNFAACTIVRIHNINAFASPDDWDALYHLPDYRGIFPQFSAHNPSPESYSLFLHCNLGTMHITPANLPQQLQGFPTNLLRPTAATITAKTTQTSPTRPSPQTRTKRLAALANRFNIAHHTNTEPKPTNTDDPDHTTDTDSTQTRKRPASPPPPPETTNTPAQTSTPAPTNTNTTQNNNNNPFSLLADNDDDEEAYPQHHANPPSPTRTANSTPPPDTSLLDDTTTPDENNRPSDHILYQLPHTHFSQATTHELNLLDTFLRQHDPTLLPRFTAQMATHLRSFADTDASTMWQFANDLTNDPNATFTPPTTTNPPIDMDVDTPNKQTTQFRDKTNHV